MQMILNTDVGGDGADGDNDHDDQVVQRRLELNVSENCKIALLSHLHIGA